MPENEGVAVTYTGKEQPFKDRIYRSGLTFMPGQTRVVPPPLAQRFLRHVDVFAQGAGAPASATKADGKAAKADDTDDTAQVLAQQQAQLDEDRTKEDARYSLLSQLDNMDRKGLIDWAQDNFKQKIPGNVSVEKARELAKGFVDQYGMP